MINGAFDREIINKWGIPVAVIDSRNSSHRDVLLAAGSKFLV